MKGIKFLSILSLAIVFVMSVFVVNAQTNQMQNDNQGQEDQRMSQSYNANLQILNDSGATGTATVTVHDNRITVETNSSGLTPGQPHAQHLHIGGRNVCPDMSADENGDGLISTAEGQPAYGEVRVSLTTEGDVSADSGLAVERFPVANSNGSINYSRTFDLPSGVNAEDIASAVVVQHGIDINGNGEYDGEAKSSLDPSLPLEATVAANCGALSSEGIGGGPGDVTMPDAAPNTGFGRM